MPCHAICCAMPYAVPCHAMPCDGRGLTRGSVDTLLHRAGQTRGRAPTATENSVGVVGVVGARPSAPMLHICGAGPESKDLLSDGALLERTTLYHCMYVRTKARAAGSAARLRYQRGRARPREADPRITALPRTDKGNRWARRHLDINHGSLLQ
jgi:hypothetical protein